MSLAYLLSEDYKNAARLIKKLILLDPSNIEHRINYNIIIKSMACEVLDLDKINK